MNDSAVATTQVEDHYKVRNLEIHLNNSDYLHLNKVIQQTHPRCSQLALYEAIGYLVAYTAHGDFDNARVYRDRDDMVAFYWNEGGRRFTMGGIWRPELGKFTFHS